MSNADQASSSDIEKAPAPAPELPVADPVLPPEGGTKGWICVAGTTICIFCTFGFLNAIGVFQTTYQETYLKDYSPADISWIFAMQLALMWAPGPLYGRLLDTFGPAPVLYPCSVLCVFALCMTSLSTEYYQIFLAQGLAFGIGAGGVFTAATVSIGQWFVKRRGLAVGVAAAGSSLGGVIFPIFLNRLVNEVGFPGAVRYAALFIGILLAASCFMVTARLPRKKWNPDLKWFDFGLFKQKMFTAYACGAFLVMWGLWAPFDYIADMAVTRAHFSPTLALYLISIINATSVPGRLIPSHIADIYGHFNVITVTGLGIGISVIALWLPFNYHPSHAGIIVFALVYGFVSGAFVSLIMPCVFKIGSIETLGQRFGTFQMVMALACLTGLPIQGAILKAQNDTDFSGLIIFASVSALVGTVLLGLSARFLAKTKGTWKV